MSRACGWGASYSGVPLTDLLSELDRATPQYVDRWKIGIYFYSLSLSLSLSHQ